MKIRHLLPFVCLLLPLVVAPAGAQSPMMERWRSQGAEQGMKGPGMGMQGQRQRRARHRTYMHSGVPTHYAGSQSPYAQEPGVVAAGEILYRQHCSVCHGAAGRGNGPAAGSLASPPPRLDRFIRMPMAVDEYLLWSIAEGGLAFGTDMPAFKDQLSEDEIWKVVAYMRAGFPSAPAASR